MGGRGWGCHKSLNSHVLNDIQKPSTSVKLTPSGAEWGWGWRVLEEGKVGRGGGGGGGLWCHKSLNSHVFNDIQKPSTSVKLTPSLP